MRHEGRSTCRVCGRHKRDVGPISHGGYCSEHGKPVFHANTDGLHYHEGPWFEKWRRAVAASVGAVIPDETDV